MRLKIATAMLLAGTVVGCASNPPPPPPMAMPEPMPAPAPAPMPPMAGTYRGMASVANGGRTCHAPRGNQTARVSGTNVMLAGMRGTIGPDGTVTGRNLSGSVTGNTANLTVMRGKCSYNYMLSNGAPMPASSAMPMDSMPAQQ